MARELRNWLLPVALALLLVLAGCSGSGGDAMEATAGSQSADVSYEKTEADGAGTNAAGQSDDVQARQRAVIRTGKVTVQVESYDAARTDLTRATRQFGGYVSDSSQRVHSRENQSWVTGQVVLRVPKDNFSALLSRAKQAGEVQEATTSSTDVTDKLVDLEARLGNLKAQRERLRTLYDEANDTEDVLEIQDRLSDVQSEIERLEAQRKSLQQRVAYSTITVQLNEERPESESPEANQNQWYETGLLSAFASSVHGVEVVIRSLAVAAAYGLPFVLAFGIPLAGGFAVWRRRNPTDTEGIPPAEQSERSTVDAPSDQSTEDAPSDQSTEDAPSDQTSENED